jgi:hypothetical protein
MLGVLMSLKRDTKIPIEKFKSRDCLGVAVVGMVDVLLEVIWDEERQSIDGWPAGRLVANCTQHSANE